MPKTILSLLSILLCLAATLSAETVALAEEHTPQGALYHIKGSFDVEASQDQVWAVLTDYSALKGVVSSMQASCVLSRNGNSVLLEQVALGRFLFFKKSIRLVLRVDEQPQSSLSFRQVSDKPFRAYDGSWTLADKGSTVSVTYQLNVSSGDVAPAFLERRLFRDNAQSLLDELKAAIARRAHLQAGLKKPGT